MDDRSLLERAEPLQGTLVEAAESAGLKVVTGQFHQFEPHGATGVLLLEQSHLAVHTWVEEGLVCVDLMTCGDANPEVVLKAIRRALPGKHQFVSIERRHPKKGTGTI